MVLRPSSAAVRTAVWSSAGVRLEGPTGSSRLAPGLPFLLDASGIPLDGERADAILEYGGT